MIFLLFYISFVTATTPIIPRHLLFSDNEHTVISLSPNGMFLGYIAPDENNVRNVFVRNLMYYEKRQVTFETINDVYAYEWTGVPDVIIYMQDNNGDENMMLFKKNISEEAIRSNPQKKTVISNRQGVKATIIANNILNSRILVGLNDKNPSYHNVYSFDLITDSMTLVLENNRFAKVYVDNNLKIRLASQEQPNGSMMFYRLDALANPSVLTSERTDWTEYLLVDVDDISISKPLGFDKSNNNIYWLWSDRTIDLGQIVKFPFDFPQQKTILYKTKKSQIDDVLFHPIDRTLITVTEIYHKPTIFVVNYTFMSDLEYMDNLRKNASLKIISTSSDLAYWLFTHESSEEPSDIFLYSKYMKKVKFLFNERPNLKPYKLNQQIGFTFKARDNVVIQAYISLPPEVSLRHPDNVTVVDREYAELGMIPTKPQKLIINVHGGPKARDYYGFDPTNAWLTNRGYAVLQVNFRGSIGFGKRFGNAGYGEFSRKMHYDILDAVDFVVARGITTRSSIAIMGASYGGYETLAALTFTPDTFACGVDIFGPSNLISLLESLPSYWKGHYQDFARLLGGDIYTKEGRESLKFRSPLFYANKVKKPIMIFQGSNDPRVKQQESDQFVNALKQHNIPVTYVVFPDEGHGFRKASNSLAMNGFIEKFFYLCLGGRYEPYRQGQYKSSAILKSDGLKRLSAKRTSYKSKSIPLVHRRVVSPVFPTTPAPYKIVMQRRISNRTVPLKPKTSARSFITTRTPKPAVSTSYPVEARLYESRLPHYFLIACSPYDQAIPPLSLVRTVPFQQIIPDHTAVRHIPVEVMKPYHYSLDNVLSPVMMPGRTIVQTGPFQQMVPSRRPIAETNSFQQMVPPARPLVKAVPVQQKMPPRRPIVRTAPFEQKKSPRPNPNLPYQPHPDYAVIPIYAY